MAGPIKRLRRGTFVSQNGCNDLMLFTVERWIQFLLPVGRYMTMSVWRWAYTGASIWVWRLLSKEWRDVWDQGFTINLIVNEACVSELCHVTRWYDDLKFTCCSWDRVVYHRNFSLRDRRFSMVTMAWMTFVGLRRFLPWLVSMDRLRGLQSIWASFHSESFARTVSCFQ